MYKTPPDEFNINTQEFSFVEQDYSMLDPRPWLTEMKAGGMEVNQSRKSYRSPRDSDGTRRVLRE